MHGTKKWVWGVVGLLLLALWTTSAVWAADDLYVPKIVAPNALFTPEIDGVLDDLAWLDAALAGAKVSGFITHDGFDIALTQPVAFVTWDSDYLYAAFRIFHAAPNDLVTPGTKDGDPVWDGDEVELFLDITHQHQEWFQLVLGANNFKTIGTAHQIDLSTIKTATSVDSHGWIAEIAFPWAALGVTPVEGMVLGLNLCGHSIKPVDQWISWSPTFGPFAQPAKFGHLELGPAY